MNVIDLDLDVGRYAQRRRRSTSGSNVIPILVAAQYNNAQISGIPNAT